MPVRFRCAYCNQLLGISRRKAGTIVRCPTCAGQVVVPSSEPVAVEQPAAQQSPALFERSDFDELFNLPGGEQAPRAAGAGPPGAAQANDLESAFDVQPFQLLPPSTASGLASRKNAAIVLSSTKATVLTVVAIVALAVAFGAGLLVGYLVK